MRERGAELWAKWRGLVSEQIESGQSVAVFCRERGLTVSQLFAWKKRLRERELAKFVEVKVMSPKEPNQAQTPAAVWGPNIPNSQVARPRLLGALPYRASRQAGKTVSGKPHQNLPERAALLKAFRMRCKVSGKLVIYARWEVSRWLIGWGADAELLEPPKLAREVEEHARRILAKQALTKVPWSESSKFLGITQAAFAGRQK